MKKLIELCVEGAKIIDICVEGDKLIEQGTGAVYNKPVKGVRVSKGMWRNRPYIDLDDFFNRFHSIRLLSRNRFPYKCICEQHRFSLFTARVRIFILYFLFHK